jgi:cleavage and polyadenylation specificity factor subunit 1
LLEEFPGVVNMSKVLPEVVHDVVHHISTSGPPISCKFRRLEGDKLEAARAAFAEMEAEGIIRRSTSPWHLLYIWCLRRTGNGGRVVTFGGSI